ncbi:DEAD/DEAH box helicase [Wohlfahrtiimonas chitiniclastica]|uniref:ATP-dependent RNA helicase RhlB n=1 Tax=Wohlfahrtiimonas chitiniclastica SH04 TaxID=1261130 RepID=L8Y252_9GAMM|nr:DEAD/DEAH box helicase [Wohlfahrtiimonas chitiniclastica]ELV09109.1 ATP-dependent RNA helicase RhlB [Wohlfahrtiimonas chitiniclastica SH04]MBS7820525.1 DEAD/DEAH box helicase [Wohlfahrtiimonas chitiniclastica]MBS7828842.1 DEAD/DEAH box helicase [Wohlfahrtiimonas chitiniclastica]MBS7836517.1 DEAD/DEAH box helicase [Wohlfahrtiimonas chitiniclastica]MBS7838369.1 DEAD/DEAH box helicase [Wohlfahrtiimonas chitiniclastica]
MAKPELSNMVFKDLPLDESLQEALEDNNYVQCTPIQALSLPLLLNGQDVVGQAQTGTGKSAAFLLATLNRLMTVPVAKNKRGPFAIIMAPTRELALQIYEDAQMLGRYTGLRFSCIYGGTGYEKQRHDLATDVDVVIGTVGRILDFYKQGELNLKEIEVVVLDEADRMFDLGFIADIRYLFRKMPPVGQRQNMFFSATFSQRILELAYEHMNMPEKVQIEAEHITADKIKQYLVHIGSSDKLSLLFGILRKEQPKRTIIFVNTKRVAEEISNYLVANDYQAAVLSGDIPQNKRERLLESFKEGKVSIMVATDVAARGLHISDVTHVINYDLPQDVEDYVHRIGRTARAGEEGTAISFACEEYVYSLPDIEEYIEMKIPVIPLEDDLLVVPKRPSRNQNRSNSNNKPRREQKPKTERTERTEKAAKTVEEKTEVVDAPVEVAASEVEVKEATVTVSMTQDDLNTATPTFIIEDAPVVDEALEEIAESAEEKADRKFDRRRRPRNMHTRGRSKSYQRNNKAPRNEENHEA